MKIDRTTSAVIVALITGLSGLGTSLINRYTVNHGAVVESKQINKRSYRALADTLDKISEDVDDNAKRMDNLEHTLSLQQVTLKYLLSDMGVHQPTMAEPPKLPEEPKGHREKRVPTRLRGKAPSFDHAQQGATD